MDVATVFSPEDVSLCHAPMVDPLGTIVELLSSTGLTIEAFQKKAPWPPSLDVVCPRAKTCIPTVPVSARSCDRLSQVCSKLFMLSALTTDIP